MNTDLPETAKWPNSGLHWLARVEREDNKDSISDSRSSSSSMESNPIEGSVNSSNKGSISPGFKHKSSTAKLRNDTFTKLKMSFSNKQSFKRTSTLQMRSSIPGDDMLDPVDADTYTSLFKKLQKELRNNTQNIMTFERAINQGQEAPKEQLKRNLSEKKLLRMGSLQVVPTQNFDFDKPVDKQKDCTIDTSFDDMISSKSRATSVDQGGIKPYTPAYFPMHKLVPQQSIILDDGPMLNIPQTPQLKRRRITGVTGELHSGKRDDIKRSAILDLENFKHDSKAFVPNPNKPKAFDFKRDDKEPPELDERSLINFKEADRKLLLVSGGATPYVCDIKSRTYGDRDSANHPGYSFSSITQSMADRARLSGPFFDNKQRLSISRRIKPPHTELLKVHIFEHKNMEKVYLPLDIKISQIIQLLIMTFFDKYQALFHHIQFCEIYELRLIDSMDPERPDRFMGPITANQELRSVIPSMAHLDQDEKGFYLVENTAAIAELIERRKLYVDLQKKVEQSLTAMEIIPKGNSTLLPICCPDLGVKSTILKFDKSARVKSIFQYFVNKIRNFNPNDYMMFKEYPLLTSRVDGLPIKFTRIPVFPTMRISEVENCVLILVKKQYSDDALEDENTLMRNQNKLNIIKNYDMSCDLIKRSSSFKDPAEYKTALAAKLYEVFKVKRLISNSGKASFMLGIDFDSIYIIKELNSDDDREVSVISGPKIVKPTFAINQIASYEMRGKYLTFRVMDLSNSKSELYCLESDHIRQIFNKMDFILRKLKGMSVPTNV